jgi:crossover junction endodeoxyribonuclease RusA
VATGYELTVPPRLAGYELTLVALPWLTANQRGSWRVSHRLIRDWRSLAAWSARSARLPRLERGHVVVQLRFRTARRRDPANWAPTGKAIVDGLVDAGVFVDDDASRVVGPDMRLGPLVAGGVPYGLVVVHIAVLPAGVGGCV